MERLIDRRDAGKRLAIKLEKYAGREDTIVLGMPRGGVVVAFEVARALGVPLDVFIVRKLGVPWHQELAMGAIASGADSGTPRRLARRSARSPTSPAASAG